MFRCSISPSYHRQAYRVPAGHSLRSGLSFHWQMHKQTERIAKRRKAASAYLTLPPSHWTHLSLPECDPPFVKKSIRVKKREFYYTGKKRRAGVLCNVERFFSFAVKFWRWSNRDYSRCEWYRAPRCIYSYIQLQISGNRGTIAAIEHH